MKYYLFGLLCIFCLGTTAYSQKFVERPFNTWSRDDSLKILTESAWAQQYQSSKSASDLIREQAAASGSGSIRGGSNPGSASARNDGPAPIIVRLHSAPPIRLATVRLQQIEAGYDKMTSEDKAAFDRNRKVFLECAICKDYYVITLTKLIDATRVEEGIFQGHTAADLKGYLKLVNDKGEERQLIEFNSPKNSRDMAVFYFKRLDADGKNFITPEVKGFKLVFTPDFLNSKNRFAYLFPRDFEFKVNKMVIGEALLF